MEFCGIQKQLFLITFIVDCKVAPCLWFSAVFLQICTGVAACTVCPIIYECIASVFGGFP